MPINKHKAELHALYKDLKENKAFDEIRIWEII